MAFDDQLKSGTKSFWVKGGVKNNRNDPLSVVHVADETEPTSLLSRERHYYPVRDRRHRNCIVDHPRRSITARDIGGLGDLESDTCSPLGSDDFFEKVSRERTD